MTHSADHLESEWIKRFQKLDLQENEEVVLADLKSFIQKAKTTLPHVIAGGGYVLSKHNKLLMIHRRGFWDLPKGKQEMGELIEDTAVREVAEECGIDGHRITSEPFSTFHLYQDHQGTVLKESVWYRMQIDTEPTLTPQTEEDIREAVWVEQPVPPAIIDHAYGSIVEVIDHFTQ